MLAGEVIPFSFDLTKAYEANDVLYMLHLLLRARGAPLKAFSGDMFRTNLNL